mmetsp:Transcript_61536/g.194767  ORF Transcript_61536/g.194767 Transcript_61536/m.194767 type:complete len:200 (-) Transcript_61536:44-643(-)
MTEVEIKLRLPNKEAHSRVADTLKDAFRVTHLQENVFFDGTNKELSAVRAVLRIRFYNTDRKCVVTLKGKSVIVDGVGTASEEEEEIDPTLGRACVNDPSVLLTAPVPLLQSVKERFSPAGMVCLGGFHNVRTEYDWEGHMIELDETKYDWGTNYEVELETPEPDAVKPKLEAMLGAAGVEYKYSTVSKFANFRNKTLE